MTHDAVLTPPRVISKHDRLGFERNVEITSKLVKSQFSKALVKRYYPSNRMPIEDVAWDCFTSLYMRKFFDRYDYNISSKYYYLRRGIRNYLIDKERVDGKRVKCISGDQDVSEDTKLFNILDRSIQDTVKNEVLYLDVLNTLRDTDFYKPVKYRSKKVRVAETKELGTTALSYYSMLYLSLYGYSFKDIAGMFKVSATYVSGIYYAALESVKRIKGIDKHIDLDACAEELNNRIAKYRGFEYVPECPKCGSTKVTFKEHDMEFGKPIHVCSDINCKNQFTPISDTPINGVKNKLIYFDFCSMCLDGNDRKSIIATLGISSDVYKRWVTRTGDFFSDMGKEYALSYLNYVSKIYKDYNEFGKFSEREK